MGAPSVASSSSSLSSLLPNTSLTACSHVGTCVYIFLALSYCCFWCVLRVTCSFPTAAAWVAVAGGCCYLSFSRQDSHCCYLAADFCKCWCIHGRTGRGLQAVVVFIAATATKYSCGCLLPSWYSHWCHPYYRLESRRRDIFHCSRVRQTVCCILICSIVDDVVGVCPCSPLRVGEHNWFAFLLSLFLLSCARWIRPRLSVLVSAVQSPCLWKFRLHLPRVSFCYRFSALVLILAIWEMNFGCWVWKQVLLARVLEVWPWLGQRLFPSTLHPPAPSPIHLPISTFGLCLDFFFDLLLFDCLRPAFPNLLSLWFSQSRLLPAFGTRSSTLWCAGASINMLPPPPNSCCTLTVVFTSLGTPSAMSFILNICPSHASRLFSPNVVTKWLVAGGLPCFFFPRFSCKPLKTASDALRARRHLSLRRHASLPYAKSEPTALIYLHFSFKIYVLRA